MVAGPFICVKMIIYDSNFNNERISVVVVDAVADASCERVLKFEVRKANVADC